MPYDIEKFKLTLRNTLRTYFNPNCLEGDTDINLPPNYKVAECFIPYSHCYYENNPYRFTIPTTFKVKRVGTLTDGLKVDIQTNSNNDPSGVQVDGIIGATIPLGSISTSYSTLTTNLVLKRNTDQDIPLISKNKYWLVLTPLTGTGTIVVAKDITNRYLSGSINIYNGSTWNDTTGDLYFNLGVRDWIMENYPRERLYRYCYPRIAVDIVPPERTVEKCIDHRISDKYITSAITIYSIYPDEPDKIANIVERSLFKERLRLDDIIILKSGNKTNVIKVNNKFVKTCFYILRYRQYAT